jgi:hypothetical protein
MVNAKSIQFPLFILEAFSVQQALIQKSTTDVPFGASVFYRRAANFN